MPLLFKFVNVQVLKRNTSDPVSKTTAIVNLKGAVDLLVSPLMLETLQRYTIVF